MNLSDVHEYRGDEVFRQPGPTRLEQIAAIAQEIMSEREPVPYWVIVRLKEIQRLCDG